MMIPEIGSENRSVKRLPLKDWMNLRSKLDHLLAICSIRRVR